MSDAIDRQPDRRREMARRVLDVTGGGLPEPRHRPGCICLEPFLHGCRDGCGLDEAAQLAMLEHLTRKVEVARRLWAFYEEDLSRPVERVPVHEAYAHHLCAIFLATAAVTADFKFLNTALKMLDGFLIEPAIAREARLAEAAEELLRILPWASSS